ncbi:hypothetical protein BGZ58_003167 [Dissophora ornata]|nr:hypothetical protein BGZ58_003167 [Dissophora ornata]
MYPFFQDPRNNRVEGEEEQEVDPVLSPSKQRQQLLRQQQLEQQRLQQLERQRQQELYEQQLAQEQEEEETLRREAALRAQQLQQQRMQQQHRHNHHQSHDEEPEMHQAEHTANRRHHAQQKHPQAQNAQAPHPQQKNPHHPQQHQHPHQQHLLQQHAQQQHQQQEQQAHGPKRRNRRQRKHEAHEFTVNQAPASHLHPPTRESDAAGNMASLVESAFGGDNDEPMLNHAQSENTATKPARSAPTSTASSALQEPRVSESSDSAEQDEQEPDQEMIETSDDDEPQLVNREIQQKSWTELEQIDVSLNELAEELDQILAGKISNRKRILLTEENLTKAMLKIDAVESGGDVSIRKRRKELIGRAEELLAKVDEFKRRAKVSVYNPSH